ncbi:hypothetical protein X777_08058, partial [Ooceraea biroi]
QTCLNSFSLSPFLTLSPLSPFPPSKSPLPRPPRIIQPACPPACSFASTTTGIYGIPSPALVASVVGCTASRTCCLAPLPPLLPSLYHVSTNPPHPSLPPSPHPPSRRFLFAPLGVSLSFSLSFSLLLLFLSPRVLAPARGPAPRGERTY